MNFLNVMSKRTVKDQRIKFIKLILAVYIKFPLRIRTLKVRMNESTIHMKLTRSRAIGNSTKDKYTFDMVILSNLHRSFTTSVQGKLG